MVLRAAAISAFGLSLVVSVLLWRAAAPPPAVDAPGVPVPALHTSNAPSVVVAAPASPLHVGALGIGRRHGATAVRPLVVPRIAAQSAQGVSAAGAAVAAARPQVRPRASPDRGRPP